MDFSILPKVSLRGLRGTPAVTVNHKTKEEVLEAIKEASAKTILDDFEVNWEFLQEEAQKFLDNYYSLQKEGQKIADNLLKETVYSGILSNTDDPNFAERRNYIIQLTETRKTNLLRAKYLLATRFEEVLNTFRNKPASEMIYVQEVSDEKGSVSLNSYSMPLRDLIFEADEKGRFKFERNSSKRILNWKKAGRQLLESKDDKNRLFSDQHLTESLAAYNGTYNRVSRFREITKTSESKPALLMWRGGNQEWQYGLVGNKGDIKEAYISLLYKTHKHCELPGKAKYYAHSLIGDFYIHHLRNVTSLSAIVEEDIVLNNIQYGVKANQAGLPGYNQNLAIASDIVQSPPLTINELEEAMIYWLPKQMDHTKDTFWEEMVAKYSTQIISALQSEIDIV